MRYRAGTHRRCSPAVTLRRFAAAARAVGVTRLADLTGLDDLGIPVAAAVRPMGLALSTSQGKGATVAAARASALMESLETWHAEHVAAPVELAAWRAVAARAIEVTRLARVGPVPRARALPWIRGHELLGDRERLVPLEAVSLDCTFSPDAPAVFARTSTGLASGNTHAEALVHALCEVIERDAEAAWRRRGGQARVVLDSIRAPATRRLLARLRRAGVRVGVWDLESRVGVPAFGAMLLDDPDASTWRELGVAQGFGCHLDAEIAVSRAITEAVQTRLTYIAGGRDDFFPWDYAHARDPARLDAAWRMLTASPDRAVTVDGGGASGDLTRDLATVLSHLAAAGAREVVAVDLSRAELGVPVVKVLVPGFATDLAGQG